MLLFIVFLLNYSVFPIYLAGGLYHKFSCCAKDEFLPHVAAIGQPQATFFVPGCTASIPSAFVKCCIDGLQGKRYVFDSLCAEFLNAPGAFIEDEL